MEKGRFSLLLLEPGEIYFEDFSAILVTPEATIQTYDFMKTEGRLKLCSKSLVFEPKAIQKPLIKIPLRDIQVIEKWKGSNRFIDGENVIRIESKQFVEMLEGNVIAPYKFCDNGKFIISLNYASIETCLPQITQLIRASTLPTFEQADMIAVIVHARQEQIKFDPLWMDLYEVMQLECRANKITPLVVNPGRVVLTNTTLYFQPYNNIEIGIEIYYTEQNAGKEHIYLSVTNEKERDALYTSLLNQPELNLTGSVQDTMTLQWQNGIISNYDYLVYINSLGDRTKNDLTQYPVFPWVILDYTSQSIDLQDKSIYRDLSKPIGALNPERARKIAERYEEMSEPKFMYGSHYSTPGFILFYLVRKYPHYMLCLQNGRFDHPDRMFNSCQHLCQNILTDMSDFKELIPEFFDVEAGGSFLINSLGINFGYRHTGAKVEDVELPRWAESPQHYVQVLRNALESEIVSENLHSWIDLIFGYKQRGEEAVKAANLFYYLCYEGNVDLDAIKDVQRRHPMEVQIREFGQIPKQVFHVPHPKRKAGLRMLIEPQGTVNNMSPLNMDDAWRNIKSLELVSTFSSHKDKVTCVFITDDGNRVVSVGYDSKLKVFALNLKRQIRSANLGNMPLSCCIKLPNTNTLLIGTYGNDIISYDLDFGKVSQTVSAHEDAILCLAWANNLNVLCSGGGDGTVCLWRVQIAKGVLNHSIEYLMHVLDHNSMVTCLCTNACDDTLAVGTKDGEIYFWHIGELVLRQKYSAHSAKITAISYSPDGQKLITSSLDNSFLVMDVNTGMPVYKKSFEAPLNCLKWSGFILLLGSENGKVYIWDINSVRLLIEIQAHKGAVLTLDICKNNRSIVTAGNDRCIKIWMPNVIF